MLIDEITHHLKDYRIEGDDASKAASVAALEALPQAARYDVNNIWEKLHNRNPDIVAKTRLMAISAPAFPKWIAAWLEFRHQGCRHGVLAQWLESESRYVCTVFLEDPVPASLRVIICTDCFSLRITDNYYKVTPELGNGLPSGTKELIEVVDVTHRFLNWDEELVPIQMENMDKTNRKRRKQGKPPLSSPVIIRIEGALRMVKVRKPTGSHGGDRVGPMYHPVAGHLRRVPPSDPILGVERRGKNYKAVIPIRPHFAGDPQKGRKDFIRRIVEVNLSTQPADAAGRPDSHDVSHREGAQGHKEGKDRG